MKITRDNYEEYFIDYLDGNLSDSQIEEFEAFLIQNPDLRNEVEGLENIVMAPSKEDYPVKENLKQIDISIPVNDRNFDFFCIAEAEGDLNPAQKNALDAYLSKNPEKKKERDFLFKLKLKPEKDIQFTDKAGLKKSVFFLKRPAVYRTLAFAASIALLIVFYFSFLENDMEQSFVSENLESSEIQDTTSVTKPEKRAGDRDNSEMKEKKEIIPAAKGKVKKAVNTISFKVGIPIASVTEEDLEKERESTRKEVKPEELLSKVNINPESFISHLPESVLAAEQIDPTKIITRPVKRPADPTEYQTIDQFVLTKFSELVFKEREENISGWGLASTGVEKINNLTGANMKLEASAEKEGKPRKLSFNSRLLSFSTPINRED